MYDPQSLNRYMFERGNPYKYTDPTGHFNKDIFSLGVATVALDILSIAYLGIPEAGLELASVGMVSLIGGIFADESEKTTKSWETALEWVDFVLPYRTKFASILMMGKDIYEGKNLIKDDPVISTFVNLYDLIVDKSYNTNNQQSIVPSLSSNKVFDLTNKKTGKTVGRLSSSDIEKLKKGNVVDDGNSAHSIREINGDKKLITISPK
ncbi:MAG: hypothetical protein V1859_00935 [archaeon]